MIPEEMEAINLYNALIKLGYHISSHGNTWVIREPKDVHCPQVGRAIRTMREAVKWAEGCEAVRAIAKVTK